jgi:serine/threonine protein kinase/cyclophilin family peptidyl-prolyl cis-trans isomerase
VHPIDSEHPGDSDLVGYAVGKLDASGVARIQAHLADCTACRAIVEQTLTDNRRRGVESPRPALQAETPSTQGWVTQSDGPAGPPAAADVPPALREHPRYRVRRLLGRGGMGIVYQAEHKVMERLVAVKVISRALVDQPEMLERFHREVRTAAKLDHPNIVKAYDAEQAGDLQLLAMEYIEGRSLAAVLAKKGPLPIAHACNYIRQAALGLQHAFERGMVHRDLKPQNLMLTPKGVVKVLDFGLAKLASEQARPGGGLTQDNVVMGTPEFMAPEQAVNSKAADIRADIYALGATLYCLLTGRPPFTGDPLAVIVAHSTDAPLPIESLRPDVPAPLAALVSRMLAKDPAQRPQTPKEVANALAPFTKPSNPHATLVPTQNTPTTLGTALAQHRRWLIPAVAAGLALIGVGLWTGGVFQGKTQDGILIVNVNEPNAEVLIDNERATASWAEGGTTAEVRIKPGKRKVEVKKDGFTAIDEEITVRAGRRDVFTATLKPVAPMSTPKPGLAELEQVELNLRLLVYGRNRDRNNTRDHAAKETAAAIAAIEAGDSPETIAGHLGVALRDITALKVGAANPQNLERLKDVENGFAAAVKALNIRIKELSPTAGDKEAAALPLAPPVTPIEAANPIVIMDTSMGAIKIELFEDKAPVTVRNFLSYVDDVFYDNTIFHRVVSNYLVQGGGFAVDRKEQATKSSIKNESDNDVRNMRGTIAMARLPNDPNSATSQFFINVSDKPNLDKNSPRGDGFGYCVFGRVIEGMDVVDRINAVKTNHEPPPFDDVPAEDIVIKSVRRAVKTLNADPDD